MSCHIKYSVALLFLLLVYSNSNAFTMYQEGAESGKTHAQIQDNSKNESRVNTGASVINIIISKIDGTSIYAKDGRSFPIEASTRIINHHNPKVRMQTGELFFQDGNLVTIIIK